MKIFLAALVMLASLTAQTAAQTGSSETATSSAIRGPGKLVGNPLAYTDPRGRVTFQGGLFIVFKTRGSFAGSNEDGFNKPGNIRVLDTFDNHDGFSPIGSSERHCYTWRLAPAPNVQQLKPGGVVPITFNLHGTTKYTATVRLRSIPKRLPRSREYANGISYLKRGRLAAQVRRLGC